MCLKKYCCYPSSGWLKLGFLWNRESRPTVLLVKGLHMRIHPSPDCLVPTMPSRRNRLQADCEPPTEQDPICCKPSTFTKTMANVWTFYLTTSHTGNFAKCKPFEKVALIFLSLPLVMRATPTSCSARSWRVSWEYWTVFVFNRHVPEVVNVFLPEHTHHVEHFEDLKTTFITEEIWKWIFCTFRHHV